MIRVIIIDDEPLALDSIALLLKKKFKDEVQVVATSNSPQLGKTLIETHHPDLVFLDVEMPGMSGIDLVRSFTNPTFRVVFITAFDAYAMEAFRVSALDYLLKPVETEDLIKVISKIKNEINKNENTLSSRLQNLEDLLAQKSNAAESKIGIGMADKIIFVNIADISYCKAEGAYTHVFFADGKKLLLPNLLVNLSIS